MRAKLPQKSDSTSYEAQAENNSDSSNSFGLNTNFNSIGNAGVPVAQKRPQTTNLESSDSDSSPPDNDLLRRILAGKRASEGAIKTNIYGNRTHNPTCANVDRPRKSSLIPNEENLLPPVTEGVVMTKSATKTGLTSAFNQCNSAYNRNKSMSQSLAESPVSSSSSSNSSSLRSLARSGVSRKHSIANDSSDARQASSSSSSLYSESEQHRRSRCSSIISQCSITSSILSETARQQLQYTLSPDLPLDCDDLYETNEVNSCRKFARYCDDDEFNDSERDIIERPATPAPMSPTSSCDDASFV